MKEKERLITFILRGLDLLIVYLSVWIALELTSKYSTDSSLALTSHSTQSFLYVTTLIAYMFSFLIFGYYKTFRNQTYDQIFSKTLVVVLAGSMGLIFIHFLFDSREISRSFLFTLLGFCMLFLTMSRSLAYSFIGVIRKRGLDSRNVLIVGSKIRAQEVIDAILSHPEFGYDILGCLEVDKEDIGKNVKGDIKVIGCIYTDLKRILLDENIDELVFAMPLSEIDNGREYISFAEEIGINIRVLPDWQIHKMTYHPETATVYYDQFVGLPTIALSSIPQKESELSIKTVLDYAGASACLLLFSPIMLVVAIAIKLTSPGPVLFKQVRSGLNGRKFVICKFRSMISGAEDMKDSLFMMDEQDGPAFKIRNDPRITKFGKLLRKTSIDELPQLINVLRGEMSLIGPRPPLPSEVEQYKPWHRRRLSMKPGLTCIWQVKARNRTDFETWMKLDLAYIDNWSIILDLKILLLTIPAVFKMPGY
ncbi:MAG: sugar transferase [Thermodesulfobacteriota bacterium]|nr:sugar transferase [Thermodesulfobacteriota bacterium]